MKHILIACGVLFVVLVFCIVSMSTVRASAYETLEALTVSYQFARNRDFASAASALSRAEQSWKSHEDFLSTVLAHNEVDKVATNFAELRQYVLARDYDDYLATVSELIETIRHMRQVELPVYYNIL